MDARRPADSRHKRNSIHTREGAEIESAPSVRESPLYSCERGIAASRARDAVGEPAAHLATRSGAQRAHAFPRRHSVDRKSTRLNSSHRTTSYAVFCLKK